MIDVLRRILVVLVMGLCIGLLFLGGQMVKAEEKQWEWPVEGVLTDIFGSRHAKHFGIDIAAPVGTQVYAVAKGVVSRSYYSNTYGQVVFIKQTNGYETVYAHLEERFVAEGNRVAAGQNIGRVGNTGRSSGAHLHFEVHQESWNPDKTNAVNPLAKLDKQKLSAYVKSDLAATVFQQLHQTSDNCILIHQGDTLSELAVKYEVDMDQLRKWNHLENTMLNAGQVLKISP